LAQPRRRLPPMGAVMSALMILVGLLFVLSGIACLAGWGVARRSRIPRRAPGGAIAMLLVTPIAAIVAAVKDWQGLEAAFPLVLGSAGLQVVLLIVTMVALPMAFLASGGQAELGVGPGTRHSGDAQARGRVAAGIPG